MSSRHITYDQAYATVKAARPVVSINKGFELQLRAYGATGCDAFASHQIMLRVRLMRLAEERQRLQEATLDTSTTSTLSTRSRFAGEEGQLKAGSPRPDASGGVATPPQENSFLQPGPRPARLRLSRPRGASVQIVSSLSSLEKIHACKACGVLLISGGSILNVDRDLPGLDQLTDLCAAVGERGGVRSGGIVGGSYAGSATGSSGVGTMRPPLRMGECQTTSTNSVLESPMGGAFGSTGADSGGGGQGTPPFPEPLRSARHASKGGSSFGFDSESESEEPSTGAQRVAAAAHDALSHPAATGRHGKPSPLAFQGSGMGPVIATAGLGTPSSCASGTGSGSAPGSMRQQLVLNGGTMMSFGSAGSSPALTPQSPHTLMSVGSDSPVHSDSSSQPQSAEKRRWLARMQLTESGGGYGQHGAVLTGEPPMGSGGQDSQWIYTEHLAWMGDIARDQATMGLLKCPSKSCGAVIGEWSWESGVPGCKASAGPPAIALDKGAIRQTDLMMSRMDSRTSMSQEGTPRNSLSSQGAPRRNSFLSQDARDTHDRRGSGMLERRLEAL
ncbi:unnamed protein product [Chrysoparadoxa australica]